MPARSEMTGQEAAGERTLAPSVKKTETLGLPSTPSDVAPDRNQALSQRTPSPGEQMVDHPIHSVRSNLVSPAKRGVVGGDSLRDGNGQRADKPRASDDRRPGEPAGRGSAYEAAGQEYLTRIHTRYGQMRVAEETEIPTIHGPIVFTQESPSYITDRGDQAYKLEIFSDQFQSAGYPEVNKPVPREDTSQIIAGGIEAFFGEEEVVLELGSGEAHALHHFAQQYPRTTFWGIDSAYDHQVSLDPTKPGVQLSKGDWRTLDEVGDKSVDRIMSVTGVEVWGVTDKEAVEGLAQTLTRVAKDGTIFRYPRIEETTSKILRLEDALKGQGWKVFDTANTGIAIKDSRLARTASEYSANPFVTKEDIRQAFTTENPRDYLEQAMKSSELRPEFPEDPSDVLAFSRILWRMKPSSLKDPILENQTKLVSAYKSEHEVTPAQEKTLRRFAGTLSWYGDRINTSQERVQEIFAQSAPLILADLAYFQGIKASKPELTVMRHSPQLAEELKADYADHSLISPSEVTWYLHYPDPRGRLESYSEAIVQLQAEPTRYGPRRLYEIKRAARLKEPSAAMAAMEEEYSTARIKYGGKRFTDSTTLRYLSFLAPQGADKRIRNHVDRCQTVAAVFTQDPEVSDQVVERYVRYNLRSTDKAINAIKEYKKRFAESWNAYREHPLLDIETFTTIAGYFPDNIDKGADIWLYRYPIFRERLGASAEPALLKDFIAKTLRLKQGVSLQLYRKYEKVMLVFLNAPITDSGTGERKDIIKGARQLYPPVEVPHPVVTLERQKILRESLEQLSSHDKQAVQLVYGLNWMLGRADDPQLTQDELQQALGTNDLEAHVNNVIARIRERTDSDKIL